MMRSSPSSYYLEKLSPEEIMTLGRTDILIVTDRVCQNQLAAVQPTETMILEDVTRKEIRKWIPKHVGTIINKLQGAIELQGVSEAVVKQLEFPKVNIDYLTP